MASGLSGVAYHEAGHVVAAWRVGAEIQYATADHGEGVVILRGPLGLPGREFVRRRLLVAFCGPEAQRRHDPAVDAIIGGESDRAVATDLLVIAYGANSPLVSVMGRVAGRRARAFVRRERAAIDAVAEALSLRGRLDAAAIANIMNSVDLTKHLAAGSQA